MTPLWVRIFIISLRGFLQLQSMQLSPFGDTILDGIRAREIGQCGWRGDFFPGRGRIKRAGGRWDEGESLFVRWQWRQPLSFSLALLEVHTFLTVDLLRAFHDNPITIFPTPTRTATFTILPTLIVLTITSPAQPLLNGYCDGVNPSSEYRHVPPHPNTHHRQGCRDRATGGGGSTGARASEDRRATRARARPGASKVVAFTFGLTGGEGWRVLEIMLESVWERRERAGWNNIGNGQGIKGWYTFVAATPF